MQRTEEYMNNIELFFEDEREEKTYKILSSYLKELESLPFFSPLQDKLQDYCDYFLLLDRMKKNLSNKQKLPDILSDITTCKHRGFCTEDFLEVERKTNDLTDWYQKYHLIIENKQKFKLTDLLFKSDLNIKSIIFNESVLETLITSPLLPFIDKQNLSELSSLKNDIEKYKQKLQMKISTLENLIHVINEGLVFNVWSDEFENLFKTLEFDIKWLANSIKLIKTFVKDYKRKPISEEIEEILEGITQRKGLDNEIANNSYELLVKILGFFEESDCLKTSLEYEILKELKRSSDQWSHEVYQVKIFH